MLRKYGIRLRIRKIRSKAKARESVEELNFLCRSFSREVRYAARMTDDMFCNQISFAINAVSALSPHIAKYLLFCVGYNDTKQILKAIRRHDRKKLRGH